MYKESERYRAVRFGPLEYSRVGPADDVYMQRLTWRRLRLHVFWRPDAEPDPHDHMWGFTTFPLRGYWEMYVVHPVHVFDELPLAWYLTARKVPAFRRTRVPATHCHKVIGPVSGRWPIVTLVWLHGGKSRPWGFLTDRGWVPWRRYLYGEKHT